MTLKQQFEAMNMGETMLTEANRATVFVNAKRAGVVVSTTKFDDTRLEVTVLRTAKGEEAPLVNMIRGLSVGARLDLFAEFELCCGMNRGECICPEEEIAIPVAVPDHQSRLERAREALASMGSPKALDSFVAFEPETWAFTSNNPTQQESGEWLREQYLVSNPKKRRKVMVDEWDYTSIIRVIGG